MKYLKVNLWGREIGRLVWDADARCSYFMFNPERSEELPDFAPLISPAHNRNILLPIYGDDRPQYQGLPPFIADSLPDSWGNTLFDKWVKDNRIPRNKVTPLYKLMFIGTRGMGALEYEPCAADLTHTRAIDIKSLYDLSLKILAERDSMALKSDEELTLQALLAVGTSAGGRQMKAIIAMNRETGEIRSGQGAGIEGYEYYILKFGGDKMPVAEIETAYYEMATQAGIEMEESRLFTVGGINHFLTRRFDRKNGRKIHIQTLAAINPEARNYEDLIATCRELSMPESYVEQVYRRMVFNVMSNNTDDHSKNFSFLLDDKERWCLAPAYDVTFIFNSYGTGPNIDRIFSIGGKTAGITRADLLDFARQNGIRNASAIIDKVAASIANFGRFADKNGVLQPWRGIIQKTLDETLVAYGYMETPEAGNKSLTDALGRNVNGFSIAVNSRGHYEISATIDGVRRRFFVRPNNPLYNELSGQNDIFNIPDSYKISIVEQVFP